MKKKSTPPLIKHQSHRVEIQSSTAHNLAKYYCIDCKVFISWLSKLEAEKAYESNMVNLVP